MENGNLFTWTTLASLAGAASLTFLIVQYTKALIDRMFPGLPTDLYAVVISTAILILAQLATGGSGMDWRLYALALANGFWVAATAGQMHQKVLEDRQKVLEDRRNNVSGDLKRR